MVELLLGIDIGTAGSKGLLVSPDGKIVARSERGHELSLPRPGWAEHDPETIWWADTLAISHELVAAAQTLGHIVGVCISGIGPCLLPADADGRPLRMAIMDCIATRAHRDI